LKDPKAATRFDKVVVMVMVMVMVMVVVVVVVVVGWDHTRMWETEYNAHLMELVMIMAIKNNAAADDCDNVHDVDNVVRCCNPMRCMCTRLRAGSTISSSSSKKQSPRLTPPIPDPCTDLNQVMLTGDC
jgi:hypothetical protein